MASLAELEAQKQAALKAARDQFYKVDRAQGKSSAQFNYELSVIERNYNQARDSVAREQKIAQAREQLAKANVSPAAKAKASRNWNPTDYSRTDIVSLAERYDRAYQSQAEGARISSITQAKSDAVTFRADTEKTILGFEQQRDTTGTKVTPIQSNDPMRATKKTPQVYTSDYFRDSKSSVIPPSIIGTTKEKSDEAIFTFGETQQQQKELFGLVTGASSAKEAIKIKSEYQSKNPYVGTPQDYYFKGELGESQGVLIEKKLISPIIPPVQNNLTKTQLTTPIQYSKEISPFLITKPKPEPSIINYPQRPTKAQAAAGTLDYIYGTEPKPSNPLANFLAATTKTLQSTNEGEPLDVLKGFAGTLAQRGYILGVTFPTALWEEATIGFGAGEKRLEKDTKMLEEKLGTRPALDSLLEGRVPLGSLKETSGSIFADAVLLGLPVGITKSVKPSLPSKIPIKTMTKTTPKQTVSLIDPKTGTYRPPPKEVLEIQLRESKLTPEQKQSYAITRQKSQAQLKQDVLEYGSTDNLTFDTRVVSTKRQMDIPKPSEISPKTGLYKEYPSPSSLKPSSDIKPVTKTISSKSGQITELKQQTKQTQSLIDPKTGTYRPPPKEVLYKQLRESKLTPEQKQSYAITRQRAINRQKQTPIAIQKQKPITKQKQLSKTTVKASSLLSILSITAQQKALAESQRLQQKQKQKQKPITKQTQSLYPLQTPSSTTKSKYTQEERYSLLVSGASKLAPAQREKYEFLTPTRQKSAFQESVREEQKRRRSRLIIFGSDSSRTKPKKSKSKKRKTKEFLGNVPLESIVGIYGKRDEISYGKKPKKRSIKLKKSLLKLF